jgi:hypothetical protein
MDDLGGSDSDATRSKRKALGIPIWLPEGFH